MNLLTSYVLRQSGGVALFVTFGLAAAAWLIQSLKLIELVVDHGVGLASFFSLAALSVPQLLTLTLPIGAFIGVQFSYAKLSADSELVVMRACGLSHGMLARGALILACAATIAMLVNTLYLEPASKSAFKNLQFQIRDQFTTELLQEGSFNQLSDTLTVYVRARDAAGNLEGLLIQDSRDPLHPVTLTARQGRLVSADGAPRVLMLDGTRQSWDRDRHQLSSLTFDRWSLDLNQYRDAADDERDLEPGERFLPDLFFPHDAGIDAAMRARLLVEGNNRIASPLYCLAFVMIALAAVLTGEHDRRTHARKIVASYLIVAVIEALSVALPTFANRHPAAIALIYLNALAPLVIAALIVFSRAPFGGRKPSPGVAVAAAA
jgi:lipopolysaccharide export system permease protein